MGKYQIRIYDIPGRRLNEAAEYDIDSDLDAIDALKSELCNHPDAAYVEVVRDGKIIWTWHWNQEELEKVARGVGDRIRHVATNVSLAAELAAWSL